MEAIKLQHLNLHATVTSPFSLSWSEDDNIAVSTIEGVNILLFDPDPENDKWKFTFKRSNIPPSTSNPSDHIDIYVDDLACSVDRLDAYNLILDSAIAPTMNGLSASPAQPTMAVWSPAGTLANARCALAIVDSFGQVSVVVPDVAGAHQTTDLTSVWAASCEPDWLKVEDTPSSRLRDLVTRSMQLRTSAVAWGPREGVCSTQEDPDVATSLVLAQRDGALVWMSMSRAGAASVDASVVPALGLASALAALPDGRVAVGGRDGRVTLVSRNGDKREMWPHVDKVAVSWLHHLPAVKALVAVKGNFVVAMGLDNAASSVAGTESLFIGGVTALTDRSIVVATQGGTIMSASVSRGADGTVAVKLAPVTWPNAAQGTCGIAHSHNSVIWAVLQSHVDCHDCTPTQLTFFHIPAATEDPMTAVLSTTNVWHLRDHFELLRSLLMYQRMEGSSPLPHLVLPSCRPERWDGLPPTQLRIWRWLTLAMAAQEKRLAKKDERPQTAFPHNKQHPLYKEVIRIDHLLALENCCQRIRAHLANAAALTPDERLSLALMRHFLAAAVAPKDEPTAGPSSAAAAETETELAGADQSLVSGERTWAAWDQRAPPLGPGPALDRALATLALDVPVELPATELCTLCDADWAVGTPRCSRGHSFPRCALSLRQVSVPYLRCRRCELVALPGVDAAPACLLCDAPLELLDL